MQYTFITFRSIPSFELQWNECAQKPMLYIGVVERNLVHIIAHHKECCIIGHHPWTMSILNSILIIEKNNVMSYKHIKGWKLDELLWMINVQGMHGLSLNLPHLPPSSHSHSTLILVIFLDILSTHWPSN